jgi:PTH1 family peptidyl-tRNA hydrolase
VKYLIFGLGNLGEQYNHTRHNIGFEVIDELAKDIGAVFSLQKLAIVAETRIKNKEIVLVKPTTFMNLSGKAVQYYMQLHKIPAENILVVTDDLALDVGVLRMRIKGSHGGHNGLRNIEETLQTQEYPRLRFGIGNAFDKHRQIDFVLGKWPANEQALVAQKISVASEAIKSFVLEGPGQAMTKYNG